MNDGDYGICAICGEAFDGNGAMSQWPFALSFGRYAHINCILNALLTPVADPWEVTA